jgi:hypothetical protein
MADIFNTGGSKATQAVIDAASKILMGVRDEETADATSEENHPIVKDKEEKVEEAAELNAANAEKELKHDCATHVVHKEHGEGRCVPGMHTLEENEDGTGYVTHYDVMFKEGIVKDVPVEDLEIVQEMSHGHKKKK